MNLIQSELTELVELGMPGAFAYISDSEGASQFYAAGVADLATQRPIEANDHYRVGSTTKTFVAVVVLQLVAEGRLSLQDTAHQWLPDLSIPNGDRLTIEHLLRMRSGLFDYEEDISLLGSLEAHCRPYGLMDVIGLAIAHPAVDLPDNRYAYCNTNYCILELIIQRVTDHSLGVELAQRIIEPLGLSATAYPDESDLTLPEPYIRGYERKGDSWQECSQVYFGRGDGGLISTAPDLARFFRALLVERKLVSQPSLGLMMNVVQDEQTTGLAYGMGLMAYTLPCGTVWGHSGGGYGYRHLPAIHLNTGRFAVHMLNGSYVDQPPDSGLPPLRASAEFRSLLYC